MGDRIVITLLSHWSTPTRGVDFRIKRGEKLLKTLFYISRILPHSGSSPEEPIKSSHYWRNLVDIRQQQQNGAALMLRYGSSDDSLLPTNKGMEVPSICSGIEGENYRFGQADV